MADEQEIKNHRAERRLFLSRTLVAALAMAILVGVLIGRIGWLQIARHDYYQTRSKDNRMRVEIVQPVRGLIYDRNGTVLAQNQPAYRLIVTPEQVDDMDKALDRLSQYVEIRAADRQRLQQRLAAKPG